jgi:hypothetical protein
MATGIVTLDVEFAAPAKAGAKTKGRTKSKRKKRR